MNSLHSALESIARRDIPENTNLWPQIAARIERKDTVNMNPRLKLAWTVVMVVLGLILATTAAYAVYRYFSDPGMQSVGEAGLIQDLNATAQPTVLPDTTVPPGPVTAVGARQTLEGVTLTLDWVFAQRLEQAFHVSAEGLAPDLSFGMPTVAFDGVPQEQRAVIFSTNAAPGAAPGIYLMHQYIMDESVSAIDISIDIPLVRAALRNGQKTQVGSFHFDVKAVPVYASTIQARSPYEVGVNGVQLSLKWINVAASYTLVHLCYPSGRDWAIKKATATFGSTADRSAGSETGADYFGPVATEGAEVCMDVGFPIANSPQLRWLALEVPELGNPSGETQAGPWKFNLDVPSMEWLSDHLMIPDLVIPTPVAAVPTPTSTPVSQSNGAHTITLLSAYADANRVVFVAKLEGWQNYAPVDGFYYDFAVTDQTGAFLDIGMGSSNAPQTDPSTITFQFIPLTGLKTERLQGKLNLTIMSEPLQVTGPMEEFHFDFDLPVYKLVVVEPKQNVTAQGVEMRLERVDISPSYTKVDLCYAKPSAGDWTVSWDRTTLQAGQKQAMQDMSMILLDTDPGPDLAGYYLDEASQVIRKDHQREAPPGMAHARCQHLGFPLGSQDQPGTLKLVIPELGQWVDETPEAVAAAQEKLKAQGIELIHAIVSSSEWNASGGGGGGGGTDYQIKKKPEGMSDDQVMRLYYEALGMYYPGPWTFTIELP